MVSSPSNWSLPVEMPQPAESNLRPWARTGRIAACVLVVGVFVGVAVQVQVQTMENFREARAWDRAHPGVTPADPAYTDRPKAHKGALGRWRKAIRQFWAGWNIYRPIRWRGGDPPSEAAQARLGRPVRLHPNMPATVILLTPFAYLPVWAMTLSWNVGKLLALGGTLWMVARLTAPHTRRPADWVIGLGLLWALKFVIPDIQHGNTNTFVLAAVVLHLWLYRRKQDVAAGAALALAICLKMTPALFLLYWAWRREGRLLAACVAALLVLAVLVPVVTVGPARYVELTGTWLDSLILPALVEGTWYPSHVNQSLHGVMARYFLPAGHPGGNIYWSPDDVPYDALDRHGWITLVGLSPTGVRWLIRGGQLAILAAAGWAMGWRKPPRGDGRRLLEYGLVVAAMLLLNQRAWEHHATVLLVASAGTWQAIAYGRMPRAARVAALVLVLAAGISAWTGASDLPVALAKLAGRSSREGKHWGEIVAAYGATFYHFLLLFAATAVACRALRGRDAPYADRRQRLLET